MVTEVRVVGARASGAANTAFARTVDSADGPFTFIVDDSGRVLASGWGEDQRAIFERIHAAIRPATFVPYGAGDTHDAGKVHNVGKAHNVGKVAEAVAAYYGGDHSAVASVPVRHHGTDLQMRGWAILREIAPGKPVNYTEFARLLGNPGAVRAAASICARNPTGLFVPCHRVLRTDGSLGGFAWGLDLKRSLLDRES